jgi:hypothetical protein
VLEVISDFYQVKSFAKEDNGATIIK